MLFVDPGLIWIPTSPNVPTWETAWGMAIAGALGELGTVSEGVGTTSPFLNIGHPDIDGVKLARDMTGAGLKGMNFIPWRYNNNSGRFDGQICNGIRLIISDHKLINPGRVQLTLMDVLNSARHFGNGLFDTSVDKQRMFDLAMGSDRTRLNLIAGNKIDQLIETMDIECRQFKLKRKKYLLYTEEK